MAMQDSWSLTGSPVAGPNPKVTPYGNPSARAPRAATAVAAAGPFAAAAQLARRPASMPVRVYRTSALVAWGALAIAGTLCWGVILGVI